MSKIKQKIFIPADIFTYVALSIGGQNIPNSSLEWGQLLDIGLRLIWWQMYSVPNGDVLDVGYRPSVWGDIQSCWDGWPVSLCPEWSWEMIFLMLIGWMSFHTWDAGLELSIICHWIGKKKHRTLQYIPLMCIITQEFNKTSSKFSVMCAVFFLSFAVKISHVSFQLAVSAADGCCLLDCLCVTSHVSVCEEEEFATKRMKLRGKKVPSKPCK